MSKWSRSAEAAMTPSHDVTIFRLQRTADLKCPFPTPAYGDRCGQLAHSATDRQQSIRLCSTIVGEDNCWDRACCRCTPPQS